MNMKRYRAVTANTKEHGESFLLDDLLLENYTHSLTHRIPFQRGRELSEQYGVAHLLAPLFEFSPSTASKTSTPTKEQAQAAHRKAMYNTNAANGAAAAAVGAIPPGSMDIQAHRDASSGAASEPPLKRAKSESDTQDGLEGASVASESSSLNRAGPAQAPRPPSGPSIPSISMLPRPSNPGMTMSMSNDRHKDILMSIFLDDDPNKFPMLLSEPGTEELDVNIAIDEQGHSALHWAAALAKTTIAEILIEKGADINRGNSAGETPLVRATLVTNSGESQTFPKLLSLLASSIPCVDPQGRTVLHHIALTSGIKGRASTSRYYAEHVLEYIARYLGGRFDQIINVQDVNGDTAINIAARVGNKPIVKMLIAAGANRAIPNKIGLSPSDFGVTEDEFGPISPSDANTAVLMLQTANQKVSDKVVDSRIIINGKCGMWVAEDCRWM